MTSHVKSWVIGMIVIMGPIVAEVPAVPVPGCDLIFSDDFNTAYSPAENSPKWNWVEGHSTTQFIRQTGFSSSRYLLLQGNASSGTSNYRGTLAWAIDDVSPVVNWQTTPISIGFHLKSTSNYFAWTLNLTDTGSWAYLYGKAATATGLSFFHYYTGSDTLNRSSVYQRDNTNGWSRLAGVDDTSTIDTTYRFDVYQSDFAVYRGSGLVDPLTLGSADLILEGAHTLGNIGDVKVGISGIGLANSAYIYGDDFYVWNSNPPPVEGIVSPSEYSVVQADAVGTTPGISEPSPTGGNSCTDLKQWGLRVNGGWLYGFFEINGRTIASMDLGTGNGSWYGLFVDLDNSSATGWAHEDWPGDNSYDVDIEVGTDMGTALGDPGSINYWWNSPNFPAHAVMSSASYQYQARGSVMEFAYKISDVIADAKANGAVPAGRTADTGRFGPGWPPTCPPRAPATTTRAISTTRSLSTRRRARSSRPRGLV